MYVVHQRSRASAVGLLDMFCCTFRHSQCAAHDTHQKLQPCLTQDALLLPWQMFLPPWAPMQAMVVVVVVATCGYIMNNKRRHCVECTA